MYLGLYKTYHEKGGYMGKFKRPYFRHGKIHMLAFCGIKCPHHKNTPYLDSLSGLCGDAVQKYALG